MGEAPLEARFREHLQTLLASEARAPAGLLLALSGGLDSTVLLHLLRFHLPDSPFDLSAAHFDHRMRPESSQDAAWVVGLCRAWSVPLEVGHAERPLRSEEEAREARYAFLRSAARRRGAALLLTAHHADDQAETVLFRVLRGTGLAGLAGIPERTAAGVLRPLLPFWREEILEYARRFGIRWREDPTNDTLGPARNRIRRQLLPEIERSVAPGARRSLVRLAALAREAEEAWEVTLSEIESRLLKVEEGSVLVAREELRRYHPAIGTRVLRKALRRFGTVPGRIGTRSALQFITHAPSGRKMRLPGGVMIRTEFAYARLERDAEPVADEPLLIPAIAAGQSHRGTLELGGRHYRVEAWVAGPELEGREAAGARWSIVLPYERHRFPLRLRARRPGDRLLTPAGRKSLKKLMIERRIPVGERGARPVLEDPTGEILWVAGIAAAPTDARPAGPQLYIAIFDDPRR